MADFGFAGMGGLSLSNGHTSSSMDEVAVGSVVPPEYGQGAPEAVPKMATYLAVAAALYLAVYVFHIVTF